MTDLGLPCWRAADADKSLRIEALGGDEALFLATHTAVQGFRVSGQRAAQIEAASEDELLHVLSDRERDHAFCVVEGEPGSGKSHLIRWLDVKWPHPEDVRLLIQRADGSLSGTLRQLKERLGEFAPLFDALGAPQVASLQGRARDFASRLGNMLRPDYFERPLPDASWCEQHGVGALIRNTFIQDHWQAPMRILSLMEGGDDRDSATASFHLADVVDLAKHAHSVRDSGAAEILARKLIREAEVIKSLQADNCALEDMLEVAGDDLKWSAKVVDALNRRRNEALRFVLGVTPDGLKRLFGDLRRELFKRGQRLVLLLEDITSWQGVDDSLIDVLVTDTSTRQDVCPLISVVGITPHYYASDLTQANYRDRITYHVHLGSGRTTYAAALRTPEDRVAFSARYLSAVRAGPQALERWHSQAPDAPPPNPCARCNRQPNCHAAFGAHDGVGLFPFTVNAIETLFDSLKDSGPQNYRTPRGLLQAILTPTMVAPHVLEQSAYPGVQVEPEPIEKKHLTGILQNTVQHRVVGVDDQERLRRLLVYWGNARPSTTKEEDRTLAFAGVRRGVFEAFDLPWLGDDEAKDLTPDAQAARDRDTETQELRPTVREADSDGDPDTIIIAERPDPRRAAVEKVAGKRKPPKLTKSARDKLRESIAAFRAGGDLENLTLWKQMLFRGVAALEPRKLGIDRFTFDKLFTPESVMLTGTGRERVYHFAVSRDPWAIDGLEGLAFLASPAELEPAELVDYRQKVATFLRRLEKLARQHVQRRLGLQDGIWNPVQAAAQVLLTRAWLRGEVSADAPAAEQWIAILRDPGQIETDPSARVAAWRELLDGTNKKHERIRNALRSMVSSPQGDAASWGIADLTSAAQALVDMQRFKFAPSLDEARSLDASDLEPLRDAQLQMVDKLPGLPHREREVMSARAQKLSDALRGHSIEQHAERLKAVIGEVAQALPSADTTLVSQWLGSFEKAKGSFSGASSLAVQDLIMDLEQAPPPGPAAQLTWLAGVPAKDLEVCWDLARDGENIVERLLGHLEDLLNQTRNAPDLATLRSHGKALEDAAQQGRTRFAVTSS